MSNIHVKVYVTKKMRTPPISVVYGSTGVGIEMEIMDYDLPAGSTAEAMASGEVAAEVYKNPCTVVGNTITMYPETGFFAHGGNEFQVVIAVDGKNILSFVMDVYCEKNIGEGNDPATPEQVLPLVQRAEAAAQNADTAAQNADASATSAAESLSDAITAKNQAGSAAAQAMFAKKACQDSSTAAADAADAAADSAAEIQGAASQIQENADAIDDLRTAQSETLAVLSSTDRRLEYLWKKNNGILYDTETLTGSGPVVDVPSGAMDFAELRTVGGMSKKSKNLCPYTTKPKNNFFWIFGGGDTGDGFPLPAGTYVVSYKKSANKSVFGYVETMPGSNQIVSGAQGTFSFTLSESANIRAWLYFPDNTTVISDAQLELGSIATSYEPYSADLIDAKVDQINSVGRNILPPFYTGETTINGIDVNPHSDGSVSIKGTASARAVIRLSINEQGITLLPGSYTFSIGVTLPDGVMYSAGLYSGVNYIRNLAFPNFTITKQEESYHYDAFLDVSSGTTVDLTYFPQLEKGTQSTQYTPYRKETVTIPASVQALDGYGIGINADCYNYVDFVNKKFVKQVGVVDLGTLNWSYNTDRSYFMVEISNMIITPSNVISPLLCKSYVPTTYLKMFSGVGVDGYMASYFSSVHNKNFIVICDLDYATTSAFIPAVSGVLLYYKLAEPVETDISDLLADFDDIIQIQAGGTINVYYPKLDDGYTVDVPTKTDIMVDVAEVSQ